MEEARAKVMSKSIAVGAVSGLLVFAALHVLGYSQVFSIPQIASDPEKFWGAQVTLTGLVKSPSISEKYLGKGQSIKVVRMSLHEPSGEKYPYGRRYVSVQVPLAQFRFMPNEGDTFQVSGVLKPPSQMGSIEPE